MPAGRPADDVTTIEKKQKITKQMRHTLAILKRPTFAHLGPLSRYDFYKSVDMKHVIHRHYKQHLKQASS